MCDLRTGAGHQAGGIKTEVLGHHSPGHIAGHMAHLLLNHGIAIDTRTSHCEGAAFEPDL